MRLAAAAFAAALSLAATARAQTPEVRIARQFSMGYLQFNVIDHEHLIQKHAAALGIPDVKVSVLRFNGPAAMNDGLLSDTVDLVGGSPNASVDPRQLTGILWYFHDAPPADGGTDAGAADGGADGGGPSYHVDFTIDNITFLPF